MLNLHPAVIIHNYLPYDLQFALEVKSYFTLNLHPAVIIHNYLAYDLQLALEVSPCIKHAICLRKRKVVRENIFLKKMKFSLK